MIEMVAIAPRDLGSFWATVGLDAYQAMAWVDRYLPQDIGGEVIEAFEEERMRMALADVD